MSDYKWKPFTLLVSAEEVERSMKLEAGKYYKTRDGRKVGPMRRHNDGWCTSEDNLGRMWKNDGMRYYAKRYELQQDDLTSEWHESPTREVIRREVVQGTYGRLYIEPETHRGTVGVALTGEDGKISYLAHTVSLNATELREAAHTLNQIAEYLENEGK